jgi:hypothetical protein
MKTFLSVIAAIAALQATPSLAQDAVFDTAAVTDACQSGGDSCLAAVQAAVAAIEASGGDAAALNTQLGTLAGLLLNLARTAPVATLAVFAQAMGAISNASTDPAQRTALNALASELNNGNVPAPEAFGAINGLSNT